MKCDTAFKRAIVLLKPKGPLGGAPKRFINFLYYLPVDKRDLYYFFINKDLYDDLYDLYNEKLKNLNVVIIDNYDRYYIKDINTKNGSINNKKNTGKSESSTLLNLYRFIKHYYFQYKIYSQIDHYRKKFDIKVFLGVFSGIIPLYFYLQKSEYKGKVIVGFSNMDSWFANVYNKEDYRWYNKYISFNYGLTKSNFLDFLSPYIYSGVRKKGLIIDSNKISVSVNSFTDYTKCKVSDKSVFKVAFSSRLETKKNPILFLEAVNEIAKKYTDIYFYLLGNGSLETEVKEYIKNNIPENRISFMFHAEPSEILSTTSVFVSLQETNNYPSQSILEAMGCENAIIATNVGDTGLFFKENIGIMINADKDELINAIEYMYMNQNITRGQGINARIYATTYHTVEKSVQYYENLFEKEYNKVFGH